MAYGKIYIVVESRENDYEHYVKCGECGWEGWSAFMRHGYQNLFISVEPMDFCPECNTSEEFAEVFITCIKNCDECQDRYLCYTALNKIPILVGGLNG